MKKLINYIKEKRKIIIFLISLILFTFLTYSIINDNIKHLDNLINTQIINIRNNTLTDILLIITNISSAPVLIILSILLMIVIKNKKIPFYISINLLCSYTTNQIAKIIFSRERPLGINLIEESGFSYPSGHSMVGMAYFGFIVYLIYKSKTNNLKKTILITTLIITILLVGISRIYLGVHYLSDVIAGFLLATIYLTIFTNHIKIEKK